MLKGKMWQFQRGDRAELVNVYYYLKGMYPITDKVYARQWIFGTIEDKTLPDGVWLFAMNEDKQVDKSVAESNN